MGETTVIDVNRLTMKTMPSEARPYEKCLQFGPQALSDAELLSIILRTGSSGESALRLCERILSIRESPGLAGLYHLSVHQLMQIRGIGSVKAIQLKCIGEISRRIVQQSLKESISFENPLTIAEYYMEEFRHEEAEKMLLLMLDNKGRRIGEEIISMGTVNASVISPREIFLTALRYRSVSIVLLHNHPSGRPEPSEEDLNLTELVKAAGDILNIPLLDHIIIGDRVFFSFMQAEYL